MQAVEHLLTREVDRRHLDSPGPGWPAAALAMEPAPEGDHAPGACVQALLSIPQTLHQLQSPHLLMCSRANMPWGICVSVWSLQPNDIPSFGLPLPPRTCRSALAGSTP